MLINNHYQKLTTGYLFPEIARRVEAFAAEQPDAPIIKLGIGDVTEPLPPAVIEALHKAVDDMARPDTFHGYGPEQGYAWLREAIVEHDFAARGCTIDADEVFVSDGSKCDSGNILDILGAGNRIAMLDPVYPVYVDTNVMAGNTGPAGDDGRYDGLLYLPATAENDFTPDIPDQAVDIVYLCYPNNPTGAAASRQRLENWVSYAQRHGALILYDAAYEAYITDAAIPHSIYEVPGARDVAIEFHSFSKNAGFTGTRCAYTVVPKSVVGRDGGGDRVALHGLWNRRHSTKFNGTSYIVQRAAAATFSDAGHSGVRQLVDFYMENAAIIRRTLASLGLAVYGGVHAPYVWVQTPGEVDSWAFFDKVLRETHVVGTPGSGFGASGEGYFRLSAFNSRQNIEQAMERIVERLKLG